MADFLSAERRKATGAYYTPEPVVEFLVSWGLREQGERTVLDPACGDGRFLAAASRSGLCSRLVGCDIAPVALDRTREALREAPREVELIGADFFQLDPERFEPVDLVVGNPPFIRYQRFSGEMRRRALASALRIGVRLSRLTSSWAPFLLHAVQFLRPGGDLAMVVPAEITQTRYGRVALKALLRRFSSVQLLLFEENLFPGIQAETCLLLARDHGGESAEVGLVPLLAASELTGWPRASSPHRAEVSVAVHAGEVVRFAEALLAPVERRAWQQLKRSPEVRSLASLALITNGYVTGDNEFFHRAATEAKDSGLPLSWLFPTIRSSRSLQGLRFTHGDVAAQEAAGLAHHLVVPQDDLFSGGGAALERFAAEGVARGTPNRFKCRTRDPWWRVPGLNQADVVVTYMVGSRPRAVVNQARALYSNSLHGLRLREGILPELLSLSFLTSLTLLSLEIEGRTYGGGILKLEPRELDRVLVAWPRFPVAGAMELAEEVDALLRQGSYEEAVDLVDQRLLVEALRLPGAVLERLRAGRQRLLARRTGRARFQKGPDGS